MLEYIICFYGGLRCGTDRLRVLQGQKVVATTIANEKED